MEKDQINAFKNRLMTQQKSIASRNCNAQNSAQVSYITASSKIIKHVPQENITSTNNSEPQKDSQIEHSLVNVVKQILLTKAHLTQRIFITDTTEILEVTRIKPDHYDDNGIPITAVKLVFQNDGQVYFHRITGKVEELNCDFSKDLTLEIETLLSRLDENHKFCFGLPFSLPEIKNYPHSFQFIQDTPYRHVRAIDCFVWYKPSKKTAIGERIGLVKARCSPCKKYFCRIVQWHRKNNERVIKSVPCTKKLKTETKCPKTKSAKNKLKTKRVKELLPVNSEIDDEVDLILSLSKRERKSPINSENIEENHEESTELKLKFTPASEREGSIYTYFLEQILFCAWHFK